MKDTRNAQTGMVRTLAGKHEDKWKKGQPVRFRTDRASESALREVKHFYSKALGGSQVSTSLVLRRALQVLNDRLQDIARSNDRDEISYELNLLMEHRGNRVK